MTNRRLAASTLSFVLSAALAYASYRLGAVAIPLVVYAINDENGMAVLPFALVSAAWAILACTSCVATFAIGLRLREPRRVDHFETHL